MATAIKHHRLGLLALLVALLCLGTLVAWRSQRSTPLTTFKTPTPPPAISQSASVGQTQYPSLRPQVTLGYGGRPGSVATYQMIMSGATTVSVGGKTQVSKLRTDMTLTQRCDVAPAEKILIRTTIDSGTLSVNDQPSPIPMIGQQIRTTMTKDGRIEETAGFQGLDLKSMQLVFPTQPVSVGYVWRDSIPASSAVPVPLVVEYRLDSLDDTHGELRAKIVSSVASIDAPPEKNLKLGIWADGVIWFAIDRGLFISNNVTSRMEMDGERSEGGRLQHMHTSMKMNMTMTLRK